MSGEREWRVTWQRQGMARAKTRLFQAEATAKRFALGLRGLVENPDARCCSGYAGGDECGCDGLTAGELAARLHERFPPLVRGPRVESRPVGVWSLESEAPPEDREPWPVDRHGVVISPDEAKRQAERAASRAAHPANEDIPF